MKVFPKATLVVCQWMVKDYPHISEFISKKASAFKNLNIKYQGGARPTLHLKSTTGGTLETLSVSSWKTENLEEFLKQKLSP